MSELKKEWMKTASFWKVEEALTEERTLDGVREVT